MSEVYYPSDALRAMPLQQHVSVTGQKLFNSSSYSWYHS